MQTTTTPAVWLSVVIPAVNGYGCLSRCLGSLRHARELEGVETIVVADSSAEDAAGRAAEDFPEIGVARVAQHRPIPELRSIGIRRAAGEIVATLGDHLVVDEDWVAAIRRAHRAIPHPAIGGAVENTSGDRLVDRAAYLSEYGRFRLPFAGGPSRMIPGTNASYKRTILERECADLLDRAAWDHVLHDRLTSRGLIPWLDPSIVTFYAKRLSIGELLVQRYRFGRSYAAARTAAAARWRRLSLAAVAPASAAIQLWRSTTILVGERRDSQPMARCWPLLALSAVAWSIGEIAGYAGGDGGASLRVR